MQKKILMLVAILVATFGIFALFGGEGTKNKDEESITLYTSRKIELIKPLIQQFEAKTDVNVNILTEKAPKLISRLEMEGENTEADVFLTVDLANLILAEERGLFQSVSSKELIRNIPERYRDSDGNWFGLSKRVRAIFYNKENIDPAELSSYLDLQSEKWEGKVLARSSSNVYNQSLFASIVANTTEEQAYIWARDVAKNMARDPSGGDTDQLRAVAAGEGDLAISNHYYYYRLKGSSSEADKQVAERVGIFLPNQNLSEDSVKGEDYILNGAHVNVSGAGVLKHSDNKFMAIKLLEFLSGKEAQEYYAKVNFEFPVNSQANIPVFLQEIAGFKEDATNHQEIADNLQQAIFLFDNAKWK